MGVAVGTQVSGAQSGAPRSASPWNVMDMHVLGLHPTSAGSETRRCLTSPTCDTEF